jgi:hypothetical protein
MCKIIFDKNRLTCLPLLAESSAVFVVQYNQMFLFFDSCLSVDYREWVLREVGVILPNGF